MAGNFNLNELLKTINFAKDGYGFRHYDDEGNDDVGLRLYSVGYKAGQKLIFVDDDSALITQYAEIPVGILDHHVATLAVLGLLSSMSLLPINDRILNMLWDPMIRE